MYKIVCRDLNIKDLYVGHTVNFRQRKHSHYRRVNIDDEKMNMKVYQFIRANGGWNNWEMVEIEKYSCNDSNEARTRERYWYELLQATLNNNCPIRSHEEAIQDNERRKNKHNDCLCGGKYLSKHKARHERTNQHQTFLKLQQMAEQQII
jgi:hypothetical protein